MKGISHFTVGIAAASCFPEAVNTAMTGNPLYFILGGVFGLLPDTIDFKFSRFFYKHDIEVIPDPNKPDPGMIANIVAHAVNTAHATGKHIRIKLNTIPVGPDLWQQYKVTFDTAAHEVIVSYGPVMDMNGTPTHDTRNKKMPEACAALHCDVKLDYQATTKIDILDGPVFEMIPADKHFVIPRFIPWHRQWSHSLIMGLLTALTGGAIWGPLAALVIFSAYTAHIALDQTGFMGSNICWPFRINRVEGLKVVHSNNASANFTTVWLACIITFWNLYRASTFVLPDLNFIKLLSYTVFMPFGLYAIFRNKINLQRFVSAKIRLMKNKIHVKNTR